MTEVDRALLTTLQELDNAAASTKVPGEKPKIASILRRLDALTGQLPKNAHPDLLHYRHRKSYQKALSFLKDRSADAA